MKLSSYRKLPSTMELKSTFLEKLKESTEPTTQSDPPQSSLDIKKEHIEQLMANLNKELIETSSEPISFQIKDDLSVELTGTTKHINLDLEKFNDVNHLIKDGHIAVQFTGSVSQFSLHGLEFKSLKGCPPTVTNTFIINTTSIQDLTNGPTTVSGLYKIVNNDKLTSLKGCPAKISKTGSRMGIASLVIDDCPALTSLDGISSIIDGNLQITNTGVASLANIHKQVKRIGGRGLVTIDNNITSCVLAVMLIDGIKEIKVSGTVTDNRPLHAAVKLINDHIREAGDDADVMECKEILINAGLTDMARVY